MVRIDKFDLFITRCGDCGQLYLGCFCEINLCDGEDDYWNCWSPISAEEAKAVQAEPSKATELLQSRRHLTWHPSGKIYWTDMPEIGVAWGGW